MKCREDLALPSLGTGPPGACCWSPAGPGVELAAHVFTLTKLFVCSSYPSSGTAAGFVAAIASAPPFSNCVALGAGCVSAATCTLPSSCHVPLGGSCCKPPDEKAGSLVPARIYDGTVVCHPLPTGGGTSAWPPALLQTNHPAPSASRVTTLTAAPLARRLVIRSPHVAMPV